MTVADLIKRLQAMPQDSEVEIWDDGDEIEKPIYVEAFRQEAEVDGDPETITTVIWTSEQPAP